MKKTILLTLLLSILWIGNVRAQTIGNLNFFYGEKNMSSKWNDVSRIVGWDQSTDLANQPGEYGLELDIKDKTMPLYIVVGVRSSLSDATLHLRSYDYYGVPFEVSDKYELRTTEVNLGLKQIWNDGLGWNLFLDGGVDFINVEI